MLCLPISSPSITFLRGQFRKFCRIEFVDEDSERDIDLLIGSDLYWNFVTGNIVKSGNREVWLQLRLLSLDGF